MLFLCICTYGVQKHPGKKSAFFIYRVFLAGSDVVRNSPSIEFLCTLCSEIPCKPKVFSQLYNLIRKMEKRKAFSCD